MATATTKYTCAATSSGMKGNVTAASDTTDLTSGIDIAVFIAKTATNKKQIINSLLGVIQKITEEASP